MSFVREINVVSKHKLTAEEKKKASEAADKLWKEESVLVKGIFKNIECPGGDLEFTVRFHKYDPIRTYTFKDQHEYEIPLGVARHINRQCKYKKHRWLVDANGDSIQGWDKSTDRYQFVSPQFM